MDPGTVDRPPTHSPSTPSPAPARPGPDRTLEAKTPLFRDPQDVLAHPALDTSDKRAILAAWASDACAEANLPHWRRLPGTGTLVALDAILDALQALDGCTLH